MFLCQRPIVCIGQLLTHACANIISDKLNYVKKLGGLNQQIQELHLKKNVSNQKMLTSEEKAQEVENILMIYDKQHDQLKQDLDKQRAKKLSMERSLQELENDKEIAELEIKSISKEQAKLKTKIKELQEHLQKKEDILYHSEFDLAKLERHNDRATGKSPDENRAHLKEELSMLKSKLEEQTIAKRNIDNLIYKLEVSISRSRKEIQQMHELQDKKEEEINETELVIETSARHAASLKQEIQELTVEDKMLSMTEIKIKDEIKLIQKEIVELEKFIVEDDAAGREKLSSFNSAKEMYDGQVRCIQGEIDDLNHQIQLRESRKEKMKVKHETIFKSLGKMEDENGDIIPSHAYYLVKLAQEKAELKDQTLVLTKKIKREESDLKGNGTLKMGIFCKTVLFIYSGMQKALDMMKSSNSNFRTTNLRKKGSEDPEIVELKEEEQQKKNTAKYITTTIKSNSKTLLFRDLTKAVTALEKEISLSERTLYQLNIDLENLKSVQEEKEEALRMVTRAVQEEDKKLVRAKVCFITYKCVSITVKLVYCLEHH